MPLDLDVRHVAYRYADKWILQDISFRKQLPGIYLILGENGVGKSLLLRLLAGIYAPHSGQISWHVDGKNYSPTVDTLSRQYIGYQSEFFSYWPEYNVRQIGQLVWNIKRPNKSISVDTWIEQFRLENVAHKRLKQLSCGYQKRVSLALSMIGNPPLLLLDEPTDGLSPTELDALIAHLQRAANKSMIFLICHHLEERASVSTQILLLQNGNIAYDGLKPENLRQWYHAQYTKI